jgi:putative membrane protein
VRTLGNHHSDAARLAILRRFGVGDGDLLGAGGESWVYALDETRVLRVSKGGDLRRYLARLKRFYRTLPLRSFALPTVLEIGAELGTSYAVEARLPGVALSEVLPGLAGAEREQALERYLDTAEELGDVMFPAEPYGQLLADDPTTAPSWQAYLSLVVERAVRENGLEDDVPHLATVVTDTLAGFAALPDPPRALVHGDYFPGNVLVSGDLTVAAVIDFSPHTVVGDPFLDVAGALIFLEVVDGYRAEDSAILHALIRRRYGPDIDAILRLYRRYYAFYFSNAKDERTLSRWCVDSLQPGHRAGA